MKQKAAIMKSLHAVCLVALFPVLASAQSADITAPKGKPVDPVIASEHTGPGRIGVRIYFDKTTGLPQIIGMTRGGPADDCGFKIGDVIIKIGRDYTNTLTQEEVRMALHGDPGTGVELTVQRSDDPKYIVRAIERRVPSAYAEDRLDQIIPPPDTTTP